ncbi:glycine N-acyltransferase-like protein 2 [Glandiceps talaboti]
MSSNPTLGCDSDELVRVPTEDYQNLIDSLQLQIPHSLKVIGHLTSNVRSVEWKTRVYVDQWPNYTVVICMNDKNIGAYIPLAETDVYIHTTSPTKLKEVLTKSKLFDWSKTMFFDGFDECLIPVLEEFKSDSASLRVDLYADIYKHVNTGQLHWKPPEGTFLAALTKKDASIVLKNWKFGCDWMLPEFEFVIKTNITSGLYSDDGQLLSWAMVPFYGGIGNVHTLQAHRRKGFSKVVLANITQKILDLGVIPWAHVENGSGKEVSERMLQGVGFEKTCVKQAFVAFIPTGKELIWERKSKVFAITEGFSLNLVTLFNQTQLGQFKPRQQCHRLMIKPYYYPIPLPFVDTLLNYLDGSFAMVTNWTRLELSGPHQIGLELSEPHQIGLELSGPHQTGLELSRPHLTRLE